MKKDWARFEVMEFLVTYKSKRVAEDQIFLWVFENQKGTGEMVPGKRGIERIHSPKIQPIDLKVSIN